MGTPQAGGAPSRVRTASPDHTPIADAMARLFPNPGPGLVRHRPGAPLPSPVAWGPGGREGRVAAFASDVRALAAAFDRQAAESGLDVRMCVEDLCEEAARDPRIVRAYHSDVEDGGRVHPNQVATAVAAMAGLMDDPSRLVLVLGALQSGKTGTALCIQFMGPVAYLLTGVRTYPFHLVPNAISHETQARREFSRFLTFYGGIRFVRGPRACTLLSYLGDAGARPPDNLPAFAREPSLDAYRRSVVPETGPDPWRFLDPREAVRRRMPVGGSSGAALSAFVARLAAAGIVPVPVIDETQYGASDREVSGERRSCVLRSVLGLMADAVRRAREGAVSGALAAGGTRRAVEETLSGLQGGLPAVLLSATPYGLVDGGSGELRGRAGVRVVPQRLPPGYVGLNCFMGLPIDPAVPSSPPRILDFREAGGRRMPFLAMVDLRLYFRHRDGRDASRAFRAWARRHGVGLDRYDPARPMAPQVDRYCEEVEFALRSFVMETVAARRGLAADGSPLGICVRFANSNGRTFRLLRELALDDVVEVLPFYDRVPGGDVKGFLRACRREPDRPFLVAVTNRARMGDAFPRQVEVFVEFAAQASDLNALLQGLLGRACGVGKSPTVVLSPGNAAMARAYLARDGEVHAKASRHVVPLGEAPAVSTRAVASLRRGMHPAVDRFLDRFEREVAARVLTGPGARRQDRGAVDVLYGRYLPLYAMAEEEGVLDLVERDPGLAVGEACGPVRLLRPGDALEDGDGPASRHLSCPDRPGWVHVGFRSGARRNRSTGRLRGIGSVVEPHAYVDPDLVARVEEIELPLARAVTVVDGRGVDLAVSPLHALDARLPVAERFERDLEILRAEARREAAMEAA